jgi:DNA-binding NtrC family response regulator
MHHITPLLPEVCECRFLVIDDDMFFAGLMGKALQRAGAKFIETYASIIHATESLLGLPDFIITDEEMGTESGLQVIRIARAVNSAASVIMVSGSNKEFLQQDAIEEGAFAFIKKNDFVFFNVTKHINDMYQSKIQRGSV